MDVEIAIIVLLACSTDCAEDKKLECQLAHSRSQLSTAALPLTKLVVVVLFLYLKGEVGDELFALEVITVDAATAVSILS